MSDSHDEWRAMNPVSIDVKYGSPLLLTRTYYISVDFSGKPLDRKTVESCRLKFGGPTANFLGFPNID